MPFVLSQENVLAHLQQRQISAGLTATVEPKLAKNFNLLVRSDGQSWLVKQEPQRPEGNSRGDLQHEWQFHQMLQQAELTHLRPLISEMLDFEPDSGVAVFRYRQNYVDLSEFYAEATEFPVEIAAALGRTLGQLHASSFDPDALPEAESDASVEASVEADQQAEDWGRLTPDDFAELSTAGLKFYQLYQRYESLGQAVIQLNEQVESCCLTHNDLKLNNILLCREWRQIRSEFDPQTASEHPIVQIIDWEKWDWGDPAADLGALVASYLKLWLQSLLVSAGMEIQLSLRLAERPLEMLQPSLVVLVAAYLEAFPAVSQWFPHFLQRVVQFAGLSLIESIRASLHYYEPFGNQEICILQVAKALLGEPESAAQTVFGRRDAPENWSYRELIEQAKADLKEYDREYVEANGELTTAAAETAPVAPAKPHPEPRCFLEQIAEIAQNLEIHSISRIVHRHHEPLQLPGSLAAHYQQLPPALQDQHLSCQLQNYLYRIYCSGELGFVEAVTALQNNQYRGIQLDFYTQLQAANSGSGYLDPNWQILEKTQAGCLVQKQGLKLRVPLDSLSQTGETAAIRLPKNRINERYYVAVGNAGRVNDISSVTLDAPESLQICCNLTTAGVIKAMRLLTEALNTRQIPFLCKARFDPSEYRHRDTAILEVPRACYQQVQPLLEQFYRAEQQEFRASVPLLMKPLAPGLGLAEQPANAAFGYHRCHLIATALIDCWHGQIATPELKLKAIQRAFQQQGLNWQRPYLNPGSPDCYQFNHPLCSSSDRRR